MSALAAQLREPRASGVYRVAGLEPVRTAALEAGLEAVAIDLTGAAGRDAVLARIARALDFPAWFGGNWDALEDCLADLSWRPAAGWALLVEGIDALRVDERGVLLDVLAAAAESWARRGRPFHALCADPRGALALAPLAAGP